MRILVTNDDGIHADGLMVMERIARCFSDDVWVVAPESDQSGVAHSLSLGDPLRLRQVDNCRFAVKGTPTDCVIMGVRSLLASHPPDLILSGVNRGQNVAEDVTYSGTIAGAMEGTLLGIRSIALSQAYGSSGREAIFWDCAETHGPDVIRRVLAAGIPSDVLVSVNFPDLPADQVTGITLARQGRRESDLLRLEPRADGRGLPYYWIAFNPKKNTLVPGTDLHAMAQGQIAITPLHLDLTHEATLSRYAAAFAASEAPEEAGLGTGGDDR